MLPRRKAIAVLTMVAMLATFMLLASIEGRQRKELATEYLNQEVTFVVRNQEYSPAGPDDELLGLPRSIRTLGPAKPNQDFHVTFVRGKDLAIVLDRHTRSNSLGFLSNHQYSIAKQANEFRIVIHGDSMTGTVTSGFEWVDRVEDLLEQDPEFRVLIGGKNVRVYNLGFPGSSFAQMERDYQRETTRLAPDLVVVNFTEETFKLTASEQMRKSLQTVGFVRVSESESSALLELTCSRGTLSLENPDCYQSFGILASPEFYTDHKKMRMLQRDVMDRYVAAKMSLRNTYPYALAAQLGKRATFADYKPPIAAIRDGFSDEVLARLAAQTLSRLITRSHDIMLTVMPLYWDYVPSVPREPYPLSRALERAMPGYAIEYMDRRMPYRAGEPGLDKDIIARWYNVPYDGHPSDLGAALYAHAMASAIKEHLKGAVDVARAGHGRNAEHIH